MARPKKEIKWDQIERRMEAGCSAREIAGEFRLDINTFYNRFKEEYGCGFADYSGDFSECGRGNIRFMQYAKAMNGNINMLMLLGKEWLGQGKEQVKESPYQENINISHENMLLRAENAELKEKLNGNQSETRQELSGSDSSF